VDSVGSPPAARQVRWVVKDAAQRTGGQQVNGGSPDGRRGRLRRWLYWLFSLGVTAGVFGYLLQRVSPGEIVRVLSRADPRGIACFVVFSLAMTFFRTWRYHLVLQVSGYRVWLPALFLVVLVRNFFSDIVPMRIGTLVYIYIVTTRLGVPFSGATSSYALAVLFDFMALAPMIGVAAALALSGTQLSAGTMVMWAGVLGGATLSVLVLLPYMFHAVRVCLSVLVRLSGGRLSGWLASWREAEEDVRRARRSGIYARMFWLSVLVRVGKYGALYFFLYALARPMGYGLADLDPARVFLGLCAAELAASTPASGIAGFGAYEGTWAVVFRLLGFPRHFAEVTSISHHLFTQAYGYGLGVIALLALLLPVFARRSAKLVRYVPERPRFFYGRLTACVAVMIAAVWLLLGDSKGERDATRDAVAPVMEEGLRQR